MSPRRIFIARHGNRQDLVDPGWYASADEPYDPPLSADGVEQARGLGRRLRGEGVQAIVASPFLRTVQTAHHANESLDVPIFLEPGFAEWFSAHSFDRLPRLRPFDELQAEYPSLASAFDPARPLQHPESPAQLRRRAQAALEALLGKLDGTLLVVSHAATVAAMTLIDPRVTSVECPICALFCLEHDGASWRLSLNGEIEHVGERLAIFRYP